MTPIELGEDDLKMREWSHRLRSDVRVSQEASERLATTIYREILALGKIELFDFSDPISYAERFNELALFLNCMAEYPARKVNPLLNRAFFTLSNYVCFVYLGDTCFTRLRKALPEGTAKRCCRYLTDNPIRALRNAVAHGNWRVSDGVLHFWARRGDDPNEPMSEFRASDADREFWFFLAACTGKSALAALAETSPGRVQ